MTILEILQKVSEAVVADTAAGGHLGADLQELAVNAVTDGFGSKAWNDYMSLFVDNEAGLARLTVKEQNENTYFRIGRAYIAANGTCGPDTNGLTGKGVKPEIQENLNGEADGKIVDPPVELPIPPGLVVRPIRIQRP